VIICVATDRCKSVQDMPILYVAVVFFSRLQFRRAYIKWWFCNYALRGNEYELICNCNCWTQYFKFAWNSYV